MKPSELHPLLSRQLKKTCVDDDCGQRLKEMSSIEALHPYIDLSKLLSVIDQTYRDADMERLRKDRALELMSDELLTHNQHLERLIEERTADLSQARDRAMAADKEKARFLAETSHGVKTPLNALNGFVDILAHEQERTQPDPKALGEAINKIRQATNRLQHIFEQMSSYAEQGVPPLKAQTDTGKHSFQIDSALERIGHDKELLVSMLDRLQHKLKERHGLLAQAYDTEAATTLISLIEESLIVTCVPDIVEQCTQAKKVIENQSQPNAQAHVLAFMENVMNLISAVRDKL